MLDGFNDVPHRPVMTEIQIKTARSRLTLGILNVGFWVIISLAGLFWIGSGGMPPIQPADLLTFLFAVVAVQSLFDLAGGTVLMPPDPSAPRRFFFPWMRGVLAHSCLLCAIGAVGYWSFKLSGGFCLGVAASSLGLFLSRKQALQLISGIRLHRSSFAGFAGLGGDSKDPSFTGGTSGVGTGACILFPDPWKASLSSSQIQTVVQRRLWQIENNLPARAFITALCWNLAGCKAGSLILDLPSRLPEPAVLLQCLWMTLWGFLGLLLLPSLSRSSVFGADRAAAAKGCDAKNWIRTFPMLTGEDGNARTVVQRVFYPIPSAQERLRHLETEPLLPILGNVARLNLFLSLATLTILGRCVHCNVGRPELWVFPPAD